MVTHAEIARLAGVDKKTVRLVFRAVKLLTAVELARLGKSSNTMFSSAVVGDRIEVSLAAAMLRALMGRPTLEDVEVEFVDSDGS